jgi:hypothetical protein
MMVTSEMTETPMKQNSNLERAIEALDSVDSLVAKELEATQSLLHNLKSSGLAEVIKSSQRRKFSNKLFSLQRSRAAILNTKLNLETIGFTDEP